MILLSETTIMQTINNEKKQKYLKQKFSELKVMNMIFNSGIVYVNEQNIHKGKEKPETMTNYEMIDMINVWD